MVKRLQLWRLLWLAGALVLAFAGLCYRLVDLQVWRHAEFSAKAQQLTHREYLLEPRRGDILDAKGNLLATCEPCKTVCADPVLIGNRQAEVAHALAPLLQEKETNLLQHLLPRIRRNAKGLIVTNLFVELKHKVPLETWTQVQETMAHLSLGLDEAKLTRAQRIFCHNLRTKAVFARNDQLRVYPNQCLAAHLLGFATTEPTEVQDIPVNEIVGQDGIEQTYNDKLTGVRGWRLTETDVLRREQVQWREQDVEARDGFNVVLTIDSVIQNIVEQALAQGMEKFSPISISGIVVRPRTGEILAMATLPSYNPNHPGDAPPEARRNRVIADMAEPGSTFKIVVVSAGLNEGIVSLTDTFDCEHGLFHFAGRPLHDHKPYGILTVEQIITKSSNIGAAKIGIKLGENQLYDYIHRFGFGAVTGLPLPGELSAQRFVQPVKNWSKVSIAQIPMGQGIAVTRMQMIMAMCAIANQGTLMRPMLVARLEDRDRHIVVRYSPQRLRQVISQDSAKQMVSALKTVVSPEGTAPEAALDHFTVAGKTGTAQKVEQGKYVRDKHFSSFVGFFPADNPELCISVMLDEPKHEYFGGQVAAPTFKQIAERAADYLSLRPEDVETPPLSEPNLLPADSHTLKAVTTNIRNPPAH